MTSTSLRVRLFVIIIAPLVLISIILGVWWAMDSRATAQQQFDNSLLGTALSVSKDVALEDGGAISGETAKLLSQTAGGPVRYHVYAPDGVFVTGYAVPPVKVGTRAAPHETFSYFDSLYKGEAVRVLQLTYVTRISGFSGPFTVTVWQKTSIRQKFIKELALRAYAVIGALVGTAAIIVWFGVNLGLKPLLDLEEAISIRNPEDLSPIRRKVPQETAGLVKRLNALFKRVTTTMDAQAVFISDAAHQLRNPIAGVLALGESILTANSLSTARKRAQDLVAAANQTSDLANRLLTLERVQASVGIEPTNKVNIVETTLSAVEDFRFRAAERNIKIQSNMPADNHLVLADPTMLREAIINLIDNAFVHGGEQLSKIEITLKGASDDFSLTVSDDGEGVEHSDIPKILARFGQADPGQGSGLGLSIAKAVAERYGGTLKINESLSGFSVSLYLPAQYESDLLS